MKNTPNVTPPQRDFDVPIVHKITEFYKNIYNLGSKVSKRDKFGIYLKVENICTDILAISIDAALNQKEKRGEILYKLRIRIEILKNLVRLMNELKIIDDSPYIFLESKLQEISKMATRWMQYMETQKRIL